jgi:peptide/nickel transport system substrate-binding protein
MFSVDVLYVMITSDTHVSGSRAATTPVESISLREDHRRSMTRGAVFRRRASRRAWLRGAGLGAAGLAGASLIGCDGDDATPTPAPPVAATPTPTPTPTPDPTTVAPGGVLREAALGVIAGVDPHTSVYQGAGVVRQVYPNLVRGEVLRPDIGLHHDLAESHEAPDETTYLFHLREDAYIHPNDLGITERAMDAEDVVASFDRITNPASAASAFPFFARWVASYEAVDAHTVRVTTHRPYAWLLALLGDSLQSAIAPRELLAMGPEVFRERAVGAGPFMAESVTEGRGYTLRRHPRFFEPDRPYLDGVERVIFQDPVTARSAFQDQQVNAWITPDVEAAREMTRQVPGVTHVEHASLAFNSFWMRVDAPPWDDERVRRAINLSMDRDEYIDLIARGAGVPMGPLAPAFGAYALPEEELETLQPYDPEEAQALLAAAGVDTVPFVYPVSDAAPDHVEIMTRQLQEVGVRARPEPLDPLTWLTGYFQALHTASLSINQSYKTPEQALLWYRSGGPTGGGQYFTGLASEELDRLLDAAAGTLDEEERLELYQEAQRDILASDPAFLNFFNARLNTLHSGNLNGLNPGPGHMGEFLYRHVWVEA